MAISADYRWGIIGCGDVCEVKSAPAYQQVAGFELVAVMSRTLAKAQDFAKRHGVAKYYDDAEALINDPDINAIYIATPPDSHYEYALQVAKAGKVCCVEKPMALDFNQCLGMQQAFERQNLPLFVAYYRRSLPAFTQIKQWLDDKEIGQVRHIDWQYIRPPSATDLSQKSNWRTQKEVAKAGYFEDIASHGLDMMCFLLGNIKQAQGVASNQQGLYTAYDAVAASMLFENGVTGTGHWNFAASSTADKVLIIGERGQISFSIFEDSPAVLTSADKCISQAMPKPSPIQGDFVQAMADHLSGKSVHPSMAQSGAHTNWVMDAILQTS
ncbi:Gfo/Idh/MocA family protein [Flavobacterium sp. W21_SRS_FM6]|uniref:Gfo/Idh/MocA family protein n=1 Tax=Flavobacterium sp. W21_SRS_FM6 TaxID=3240268 RepID=UPI003F8E853C